MKNLLLLVALLTFLACDTYDPDLSQENSADANIENVVEGAEDNDTNTSDDDMNDDSEENAKDSDTTDENEDSEEDTAGPSTPDTDGDENAEQEENVADSPDTNTEGEVEENAVDSSDTNTEENSEEGPEATLPEIQTTNPGEIIFKIRVIEGFSSAKDVCGISMENVFLTEVAEIIKKGMGIAHMPHKEDQLMVNFIFLPEGLEADTMIEAKAVETPCLNASESYFSIISHKILE